MKIIMLSGFLGSGKTTCVISLADYVSEQHSANLVKLVVIENEAAGIGVDNQLLQSHGLEVRTLAAGCICCTLNGDLITTLVKLQREYQPEYVIFEPSGIANPKQIWDSLNEYTRDIEWARQITVVDAARWEKIRWN